MDDLLAFLKARLDEDEQAARKAASLCGCHPASPSWLFDDEATDGRILVADDPHPNVKRKLKRRWNGSYDGLFMAEHIARHDPARVLREVEAKRRTLTLAEEQLHNIIEPANGEDLLKCLALSYSDHSDYREEWKP